VKRIIAITLSVLIFLIFMTAFARVKFGNIALSKYFYFNPVKKQMTRDSVPSHYLKEGIKETGSTNIVTAVVVDYRGFDTLGEVTVLFLASIGVGALMYIKREEKRKVREANEIVKTASAFLFGFIVLFGAYIFVHGHLTPGGGFPGGSVIASAYLLLYLAYPKYAADHSKLSVLESLAGLTFLVTGLLGIIFGGHFLYNFLPYGVPRYLFSAGVIPVIYVAVGIKVGSELTGIVDSMMGVRE